MALFDILNPLLAKLKALLGPFGKLLDLVGKFFTGIRDAFNTGNKFAADLVAEIAAWKDFAVSVPYKTGVINIPKAVEQTRALLDQIVAAWRAIADLGRELKSKFEGIAEDPAGEAEEALQEMESGGLKNFLERFPKLAKGLEKVLGVLVLITDAISSIENVISDLAQILAAVTAIREEIETGSTVFLQQKNSRKRVLLQDGGSMQIRIGSLHN